MLPQGRVANDECESRNPSRDSNGAIPNPGSIYQRLVDACLSLGFSLDFARDKARDRRARLGLDLQTHGKLELPIYRGYHALTARIQDLKRRVPTGR